MSGSASGMGRVGFPGDGVGVGSSVRRPDDGPGPLSRRADAGEARKLMTCEGEALLVPFAFSTPPFAREQVEEVRDWPSPDRGRHRRSASDVSHHHVDPEIDVSRCHRLNDHVRS